MSNFLTFANGGQCAIAICAVMLAVVFIVTTMALLAPHRRPSDRYERSTVRWAERERLRRAYAAARAERRAFRRAMRSWGI